MPDQPYRPATVGAASGGNPLRWVLDLFSSIPLGIALLSLLFLYSWLGSAGLLYYTEHGWMNVQVRQWRGLEMTEFEWFHWWPFKAIIALICLNIIVATLRRIPFKPVNYGVWTIHAGILTLCAGSVIYFSTKLEGDAPVIRRQITINVPGARPVSIPAIPGNSTTFNTPAGQYAFQVWSIDPQWELLTGEDKGERAFSVTMHITTPTQMFLRQLITGYPDYTEDLVTNPEGPQPFARAVKVRGTKLVDEKLSLALEYQPQEYFYLANRVRKSWALYVRRLGTNEWIERPVSGLPLYKDYITSRDDVWLPGGAIRFPIDPLDVDVPSVSEDDPLHGTTLHITSYLRYATMESRAFPASPGSPGARLNPRATVRLERESEPEESPRMNANSQPHREVKTFDLIAFDPQRNFAEQGLLRFNWITAAEQIEAFAEFREASLHITIADSDIAIDHPMSETTQTNPDLAYTAIDGTPYSFRVASMQNNLSIAGRNISVAMVDVRKGEETFRRWVFDDPAFTRDLPVIDGEVHDQSRPLDGGITFTYRPGQVPPPVQLIAGPTPDDLHAIVTVPGAEPRLERVTVNETLTLARGITMTVTAHNAYTISETRPRIVPIEQRERELEENLAMVKVSIPGARSSWVPFHSYPFESRNDTLRRYPYQPAVIDVPDVGPVEVILSRQRHRLPHAVVLDDFTMQTHVGGYTGSTSSVLNWTSKVRFAEEDGAWGEVMPVSVNAPVAHGGFSYFQAQWDAPMAARSANDRPSRGLNYTVLGVGNRHGVLMQLVGCCLAVIGMIYAFYVKPIIKRHQRSAVYATVAAQRGRGEASEAIAPPSTNGAVAQPARARAEARS